MTDHRRQYVRQPGPFDGAWSGPSEHHDCRIANLNPGGCFVDCPTAPAPESPITVTVVVGDSRFTVPAEVTYRDVQQGFGVRFLESDQTRTLAYAMGPTEPAGYTR